MTKLLKTPYEYFCKSCEQFRLCLNEKLEGCGNCGSSNIVRGDVNVLDKDKLKSELKYEQSMGYKVE